MKIGDEVILIGNKYIPTIENPTYGTKFSCKGKITKISKTLINVEWENGICNDYRPNDNVIIPNIAPQYKSIW